MVFLWGVMIDTNLRRRSSVVSGKDMSKSLRSLVRIHRLIEDTKESRLVMHQVEEGRPSVVEDSVAKGWLRRVELFPRVVRRNTLASHRYIPAAR
jgi:hypothetical protein